MLHVIDFSEEDKWNSIVSSFRQSDAYWLNGYVDAFYRHGDGEPILFYYEDKMGKAINVAMKRDVADSFSLVNKIEKGKYYDLGTPYGYGGWLIEGDPNRLDLNKYYSRWCCRNNVIAEFMRFHPSLHNYEDIIDGYDCFRLGSSITMDIENPDLVWSNLSLNRRNKIRKAIKAGVKVQAGTGLEALMKFKVIYESTMDADNASDYYYFNEDFYRSIAEKMEGYYIVFNAILEGELIGSSIFLANNGMLNYHLSGAYKEYNKYSPMSLIIYRAAIFGSAFGCKKLHLGSGVGVSEDSLWEFKKSFYRGEPTEYWIGGKVFKDREYERLVELSDVPDTKFFPKYRYRK